MLDALLRRRSTPEVSSPSQPVSLARSDLARHLERMCAAQVRLEAGPMLLQRAASGARLAHEGAVRELADFNSGHATRVREWAEAGGIGEPPVADEAARAHLLRQVEQTAALREAREAAASAADPMRIQLCRELDGLRDGRAALVEGVLEEEVEKLAACYRARMIPVVEVEGALGAMRSAAMRRGNGALANKVLRALKFGRPAGDGPERERDRAQTRVAFTRARERWSAFAVAVEGDAMALAPTFEEGE